MFARLIRIFNAHHRSGKAVSLTDLTTEVACLVRHPSADFDAIRAEVERFFGATLLGYESALHRVNADEALHRVNADKVIVQDASEGTQLHDLLTQWWNWLKNAGRVDAQTNRLLPLAAPDT